LWDDSAYPVFAGQINICYNEARAENPGLKDGIVKLFDAWKKIHNED
jgi:hypothetical protein